MVTMIIRLLVTAATAVLLLLSGCKQERRQLSFSEAKTAFHKGMSIEDAKKIYGEPDFQTDLGEEILWNYIPKREIEHNTKGNFSGFILSFKEGKAVEIIESNTSVN